MNGVRVENFSGDHNVIVTDAGIQCVWKQNRRKCTYTITRIGIKVIHLVTEIKQKSNNGAKKNNKINCIYTNRLELYK